MVVGASAAVPPSFAEIVSRLPCGRTNNNPSSPRALAKSFSNLLENGGSIQIKEPGSFKGEPAVFFSKEEIKKLASPFRFTLVGKFPLSRPPMVVIRKFFTSLGLKSLKSVGLLQENYIIIFISQEEDYSRLLLRANWYVYGSFLKISKWSPDFFPNCDSPLVPVWTAFPGLPIHFFEKAALFSIGSAFGAPLKIDEPTALLTRPTVARFCIDMDVSKSLPNRLWIGDEKVGFWQEVVFENPPSYCGFCNLLGHRDDGCFVKNPELKIKKDVVERLENKGKEQSLVSNFVKKSLVEGISKDKQPLVSQGGEEEWRVQKSSKWRKKSFLPDPSLMKISEKGTTSGIKDHILLASSSSILDQSPIYLTPFNQKNKISIDQDKPSNLGRKPSSSVQHGVTSSQSLSL